MRAAGVPKVVAVSAAGVGDSAARMNAVMRFLVATSSIGVAYRDLAEMERVYAESGLDWCCVRPVALTNGERTGRVRTVEQFGATSWISRADVAGWMLDQVERPIVERLPQIAGG
jgi:putative NADH-flavin reductase